MRILHDGYTVHLVDKKRRHYALTLKAEEVFQYSGHKQAHDDLIDQVDGSLTMLSGGKQMLALLPTLGEYVLKMPRGAQVIYPKDLATIVTWADIYPGARVFEAGTGSGALTMALLRAVGPRGEVVTYEAREDFARVAMKNIERYMGAVPNLVLQHRDVYEGIEPIETNRLFDRLVLDLPEPWRVVPFAANVLRSGGVYLSYVPTVPQVMQTVEALERNAVFGLVSTFETLLRTWNIDGRSVRPDHRMIAHSGFITVARKIAPGWGRARSAQKLVKEDSVLPPELTEEDEANSWGA